MPLRLRYGTWAEFVSVNENCLLIKPDNLSFPEVAGLPKSALVAYGAVKSAGFISIPVLETSSEKPTRVDPEDVEAAMDILTQRILAIQAARQKGGTWEKAEKIGLIGGSGTSLAASSLLSLAG